MDSLELATGYIASPPDYRDHIASAAIAATLAAVPLEPTFDTDLTVLGPVMMQAFEPACVSHSIALKLKLYWYIKTGKVIDFSPRFLDTLVKRFDGLDRATDGTYPRLVFKLAVKYGCATQATVPNDTSLPVLQYRDDTILTPAAFAEAAQYQIPGFLRIPDDFTSMRAGTQLYRALSMGMYIGKEWWTNTAGVSSWRDNDIDPLRPPAAVVSGHQVILKGWMNGVYNTLRNSWSDAWANKGEATYDTGKWAPFIEEAWAIAEIPQDVVDFLAALPAVADFHYQWNTDLAQGDFSDDVKFAQIAFMILGYLKPVTADELGHFGPKTAAANMAYQIAHKISPVPGKIGPATRTALNTQFAL